MESSRTHPTEGFRINSLTLIRPRLERLDRPRILDLGPLSGQTINCLAGEMGCRVRVHDLGREAEDRLTEAVTELRVEPEGYHLALLWGLLDHLSPSAVNRLRDKLWEGLVPGGLVVAYFGQHETKEAGIVQYNLTGWDRVWTRETEVRTPVRNYPNRAVLNLLAPFTAVSSFILRDGLREFVFSRPQSANPGSVSSGGF